jgi:hypothetical protein
MSRFYSIDDLIKCAIREAGMRKRVYPKWVSDGRMNQVEADWQLECMEAIVQKLKEIAGRKE